MGRIDRKLTFQPELHCPDQTSQLIEIRGHRRCIHYFIIRTFSSLGIKSYRNWKSLKHTITTVFCKPPLERQYLVDQVWEHYIVIQQWGMTSYCENLIIDNLPKVEVFLFKNGIEKFRLSLTIMDLFVVGIKLRQHILYITPCIGVRYLHRIPSHRCLLSPVSTVTTSSMFLGSQVPSSLILSMRYIWLMISRVNSNIFSPTYTGLVPSRYYRSPRLA